MDKKTAAAVAKYTKAGCLEAFFLNNVIGEGPHTIAIGYPIPNVTTVAAANAAINAGRELSRIGPGDGPAPAYEGIPHRDDPLPLGA